MLQILTRLLPDTSSLLPSVLVDKSSMISGPSKDVAKKGGKAAISARPFDRWAPSVDVYLKMSTQSGTT